MGKRVSNLYRYAEVGQQANHRYLEHLAQANLKSKALPHLDDLYRSHTQDGKRFTRFNPLQDDDRNLFAAILSGEFTLSGFRNRDLCGKLYAQPAASDAEGKQRCARSSRLIANLCGHVLVAKVKDARLYRITKLGSQVLFAVLCFYKIDFPIAFQSAQ